MIRKLVIMVLTVLLVQFSVRGEYVVFDWRAVSDTCSILDDIPGIGPKRKKALIKNFGSIEVIKEASEEELCHVKGITPVLAQKLKQYL